MLFLSGTPRQSFRAKFNQTYLSPQAFIDEIPFEERDNHSFGISAWKSASSSDTQIMTKLEAVETCLSDIVELAITGVKTGANSVFVFEVLGVENEIALLRPEDTDDRIELERTFLLPYLKAESLKRYRVGVGSRLLLYPYTLINGQTCLIPEEEIKKNPLTWKYLHTHKQTLEGRQKGKLKGPYWYGLSFASSLSMFTVQKLVTPTLSPMNSFALHTTTTLFPQGAGGGCGLVLKSDYSPHYILGLLNSKLLTFYFQRISSVFQSGWYAYEPRYLRRIPIRAINSSNSDDVIRHARMVSLVERILSLHAQLGAVKTPNERVRLERQIEATDGQIDALVYELYGLTEDEVRVVEGK
jgi:hypothetical protein